jgi:5-amino-6-(5-phosphoribosylamino)uracil reductase
VDQLLPTSLADVDPVELVITDHRPTPSQRPWVLVNMVASIDGAIEVDGRSGGLGSPGDKAMFHALRQLPDVIMAGAGTVGAENYGPVQLDAEAQARRVARGQLPIPRLAVVSGRAHLDPASKLFSDPTQRPIVITSATAPATSVDSLRDVADIVIAGNEGVDLRAALQQLREQNLQTLLCEGGPTLNNQLLADDLVDEWCQTIAPLLTGGDATRGAYGPTTGVKQTLQLSRIIVDDDVLLLRYARES